MLLPWWTKERLKTENIFLTHSGFSSKSLSELVLKSGVFKTGGNGSAASSLRCLKLPLRSRFHSDLSKSEQTGNSSEEADNLLWCQERCFFCQFTTLLFYCRKAAAAVLRICYFSEFHRDPRLTRGGIFVRIIKPGSRCALSKVEDLLRNRGSCSEGCWWRQKFEAFYINNPWRPH